jgi:hypothetical protein
MLRYSDLIMWDRQTGILAARFSLSDDLVEDAGV